MLPWSTMEVVTDTINENKINKRVALCRNQDGTKYDEEETVLEYELSEPDVDISSWS